MMTTQNWIDALDEVEIEAGDEITLKTESEHEKLDGEATVAAKSAPGKNHWLELEHPGDDMFMVAPSSSGGVWLIQGSAVRATGVISNRRDLAEVHGIEAAE